MNDHMCISQVLIRLFRRINSLEEKTVCTDRFKKITLNEIYVIEAIGEDGSKNMSAVAKALNITTGTLTTSVNALVRKGLVERVRSDEDKGVVLISLTNTGREVLGRHKAFHEEIMGSTLDFVSDEELEVFLTVLNKLNRHIESNES